MNQLYIDHQSISPLIHALEDIVTMAQEQNQGSCTFCLYLADKFQLRHDIYQQFTNILYAMHMEKHGTGLAGDADEVKIEEGAQFEKNDA